MRTNPILQQALRRGRWPSMRATIGLAVGLWGLGLAIIRFYPSLLTSYMTHDLAWALKDAIFFSALLSPAVTMALAAVLTAHAENRGEFQMALQTPLAHTVIAQGYLLVTLYRLRLPLVLVIGLMNLLAPNLSPLHTLCSPSDFLATSPSTDALLAHLPMTLWIVGFNLLGASLGVALVLRWGRPGLTGILISLGISAILCLRTIPGSLDSIRCCRFALRCLLAERGLWPLWRYLTFLLAPYVLAAVSTRIKWGALPESTVPGLRLVAEMAVFACIVIALPFIDHWAMAWAADYRAELIERIARNGSDIEAWETLRRFGWPVWRR